MHIFNKTLIGVSALALLNSIAYSHGYIEEPPSRAFLCSEKGNNINKNCGSVQYEPQSVEALKGFPKNINSPHDGKIASGNKETFSELDEQSENRWKHVDLKTGKNTFKWHFTANHKTTGWQFFITKPGWNPEKPLSRSQFEKTPFCTKSGNDEETKGKISIDCKIDDKYTGYHVILGVWTIADTPHAFYQVIDANIKN